MEFSELKAYKNLFYAIAKGNGDKALQLTSGQIVTPFQYYAEEEIIRANTLFAGKKSQRISVKVIKNPLQINESKTKRSTGVNFTHAQDSLIMYGTVKRLHAQGIDVAPIHDSFRIAKKHKEQLNKAYKEAYHEVIFEKDLLTDVAKRIAAEAEPKNKKEIEKALGVIYELRKVGSEHKKEYAKEILEVETKKVIKVGFLDTLK